MHVSELEITVQQEELRGFWKSFDGLMDDLDRKFKPEFCMLKIIFVIVD